MKIRPPAVAGQFYPADAGALRDMVARMVDVEMSPGGGVRGLVAPHAGYPYSGATAGHAFAALKAAPPKRVVIMGPSHHYRFDGAAIITEGAFATPLGLVQVDAALASELDAGFGGAPDSVHAPEHAIEVELPFLQAVAPEATMVPVLFGDRPSGWHAEFGRKLAEFLGPEDVVIVSTDWSHYLDNDTAHGVDRGSIEAMLSQNVEAFQRDAAAGRVQLCGASAAVAGMACALARGAAKWQLLDYRTSGDSLGGDTSRVVGYAALTMEQAA